MKKILRKITLYAANGRQLQFTRREMYKVVTNLHFTTFITFAAFAMYAGALPPDIESQSLVAISFVLSIIVFFTTYVGLLSLLFLLPTQYIPKIIPSPVMCLFSVGSTVLVVDVLSNGYIFPEGFPIYSQTRELLIYYVLVVIFDTIFISYVAPEILKQIQEGSHPEEHTLETPENAITLGKIRIPKVRIMYVSAVSHHVNVVTSDGTIKIRARMGDIVVRMTSDEGIQIHRSHWVSRQGIKRVSKANGKLMLEMHDSTLLTVSRGRQKEVQVWLNQVSTE